MMHWFNMMYLLIVMRWCNMVYWLNIMRRLNMMNMLNTLDPLSYRFGWHMIAFVVVARVFFLSNVLCNGNALLKVIKLNTNDFR